MLKLQLIVNYNGVSKCLDYWDIRNFLNADKEFWKEEDKERAAILL